MKELGESYIGWESESHKEHFNFWNKLSSIEFKFRWGSYLENKKLIGLIKPKDKILEVGCATGTTVRWLKSNKLFDKIGYTGIDISGSVIRKAKSLYPSVNFIKTDIGPLKNFYGEFDIVFSRDTVLHQEKPLSFIDDLIKCSKRILILRLRTRDDGKTEYDINKSCQLHYDKYWMPYIVLNINELISHLKKNKKIKKIEINKSFEVLGGNVNRYLPKDLYFQKAGGSETVIIIHLNRFNEKSILEIDVHENLEGRQLIHSKKLKRIIIFIFKKLRFL